MQVSVVIPTYNRAALVGRAVASALAAVDPGDEIIVVDDGSTDGTEAALSCFGDRIMYIRQPRAGAGPARNRGVGAARRPWVAFLDSDDEWLPDTLRLRRAVLAARPDVLFAFSDFAARGVRGESERQLVRWTRDHRPWDAILGPGVAFSTLAALPSGRTDFTVHVGALYAALMRAPYVAANTLLVRRDRAGDVLHFPEDLPTYEEWECFARLARRGPAAFLDCATARQWSHAGPRLTDADVLTRATTRITLLQRVWGQDPAFLAGHRVAYAEVLRAQRLVRARALIRGGRTAEARRELAAAGTAPAAYRMAAALPGGLAQRLWSVRGRLRRARRAEAPR
jgi:GT2 family glycosyltransferase